MNTGWEWTLVVTSKLTLLSRLRSDTSRRYLRYTVHNTVPSGTLISTHSYLPCPCHARYLTWYDRGHKSINHPFPMVCRACTACNGRRIDDLSKKFLCPCYVDATYMTRVDTVVCPCDRHCTALQHGPGSQPASGGMVGWNVYNNM